MERREIKRIIRELESIRGRHTELISLYIPAGSNIHEISNQLIQEKGTAENIKSKATRKNVIAALEKIIQHLKYFKETPKNGLVVFCGNVSKNEGESDIKLWSFEPPEPLKVKKYWCDQVFVTEYLKEMIEEKDVYGLIVLDASEANIGLLKGKEIVSLKNLESNVPSKSVKGGMCVDGNSLVFLDGWKKVEIKKLKNGQKILSYDLNNNKIVFTDSFSIFRRKVKKFLKIVLDNGNFVEISKEHKVFIYEDNKIVEKFAEDLKINDILLTISSNENLVKSKIIEINEIEKTKFFYDLYVPKFNSYFVNGILVHNSQMRYDRIREQAIIEFLTKVGEVANNIFLNEPNLEGIIIGGPGYVKNQFAEEDYLNYQLKNKILGVKDTGYTGIEGLKELVEKSKDLIKETELVREKEVLIEFFKLLKNESKNVVYKLEDVLKAIEFNAISKLLINENIKILKERYVCSCGNSKEIFRESDKIIVLNCEKCNAKMNLVESLDITDEILDKVKEANGEVFYISGETEEAEQFLSITNIAAILRFQISI